MPILPEYNPTIFVASIGGSTLFSEPKTLSPFARNHLPDLIREHLSQSHTLVAIIGGGPEARARMATAQTKKENISQHELDEIGILVTKKNAQFVADWLRNDFDIRVQIFIFKQLLSPGVVYLGYGTEPGHNTDYVAVQAALEAKQSVLLNISNQPGLLESIDGRMTDIVIPRISWSQYLQLAPTHYAGIQHPFPKEAATLAMENGMTVVILGSDIGNIKQCIRGEEFIGTVIHP